MPSETKGLIDLSVTERTADSLILKSIPSNPKEIRSHNYIKIVNDEFFKTFPEFCKFFSTRYDIQDSQRLINYLQPWWMQAVFFKLDRKLLSEHIIKNGAYCFKCNRFLKISSFINHTDIKNEIGTSIELNNFYLSLVLKESGLQMKALNHSNFKQKKTSKETIHSFNLKIVLKKVLQFFINTYVLNISNLLRIKLILITDTSNFSKFELFLGIFFCKYLPIIELEEIKNDIVFTEKNFDFNDTNSNLFLFEIFASDELARIYKKYKPNPSLIKKVKTYKGFINNLNTRSFITSLSDESHVVDIYPHGGLNHAIWNEEMTTAKLLGANWKNLKITEREAKYHVKNRNVKNGILITLFSHTDFVSRFRSGMTQYEYLNEYLIDTKYIFENIDTSMHKIRIRLPLDNRTSRNDIARYEDLGFEIDYMKSIQESLSMSAIHLPTYNATLPLYSLINNIPSIFFWRDHHFPLPKSFDHINHDLKKNKILFSHPKNITKYINNTSISEIKFNWNNNQSLIEKYRSMIFKG